MTAALPAVIATVEPGGPSREALELAEAIRDELRRQAREDGLIYACDAFGDFVYGVLNAVALAELVLARARGVVTLRGEIRTGEVGR